MCNECVTKEFPEEVPILTEKPVREWPDPDNDLPKSDPEKDPDDRIRCKG
jgi:hypothetical protein